MKQTGEAVTYSRDDVRRAFDEATFLRAEAYHRKAHVIAFSWTGEGSLTATVQGSGRQVYSQTVEVSGTPQGRLRVTGSCTCPVGLHCKHIAAALLAARTSGAPALRREAAPDGPAAPPSPAPPATANPATSGKARPAVEAALPPDVADWFERLTRTEERASDDYPPNVQKRLVYVLFADPFGGLQPRLGLRIKSARLLKNGTFSATVSDYDGSKFRFSEPPRFVRPADAAILRRIETIQYRTEGVAGALRSEIGPAVLADILETGRARWGDVNGPVLGPGPAREARIEWVSDGRTSLHPRLALVAEGDDPASLDSADLVLLNAVPPVYVRPCQGRIGELETGLAPAVVNLLLEAPAVPAASVALLGEKFRRSGTAIARAAPPILDDPLVVDGAPLPILKLTSARLPAAGGFYPLHGGWGFHETVPIARPVFRYDDFDVAASEGARVVDRMKGNRPAEIHRDAKREKRALEALAAADLVKLTKLRRTVPPEHRGDLGLDGGELDWLDFLHDDVPLLESSGWRVEIADDFPIKLLRGSGGAFEADIRESSGIDWFELDLGVVVDGERIDLVAPLIAYLAEGMLSTDDPSALDAETIVHLSLSDGRYLSLPFQRLRPIIETLSLLLSGLGGGSGKGPLRFSALDAAALAALETADELRGATWTGGERVRALGAALREAGGIADVALPDSFRATLRPYQARGIAWLSFLADAGLGGILADDMGLGKTVQALGLIAIEKAAGRLAAPVLVIAPTSLMVNWRREAEKFCPDLRVLTLQGSDRKSRFDEIDGSDVVLTTYPLIARDHEVLDQRQWHMILLDEAQTIKNPNAATTKLIHRLKSSHRFCLTGTPLENHLGELWSLFHFVAPGFLGDLKRFNQTWRAPIERNGDTARAKMLAARVKPFLLRRTKDEVATDLPAKTEIVERVEFGSAQRDLYESVRLTMHDKVVAALAEKGLARSRIVVLDALLKMRQACCDPRLVKLASKPAGRPGSAKLDRLMEIVTELLAEGRRILIFSQFTSMLDLIRPLLDAAGVRYALLTGDTKDRESQVVAFQDGAVPVFLVSLKAGGVGLNLTAADTVILYDPWWNPAVENQAIDRAHRIGQDKPVFVHKLVAVGTIEEKIEMLKVRKQALAESIFDHDGAPTLSITEDDIAMLFADA
ncbi:DEAD/DEAH box helicase [Aurantimonas sp. 22II-16-19i]|uniref:DEAD/DEAH box helicase n=1 Tax=Aurantimonas sp. 22II-16-19i TaxID=1317114 RepID=UPI0009F7B4C5|nr:DEAD/DEAH box helicase [Aurantimonas sp. 22II-16-19i]ORE99043.1 putative helicase [Aurantimonas sp. 22II-16-19i]